VDVESDKERMVALLVPFLHELPIAPAFLLDPMGKVVGVVRYVDVVKQLGVAPRVVHFPFLSRKREQVVKEVGDTERDFCHGVSTSGSKSKFRGSLWYRWWWVGTRLNDGTESAIKFFLGSVYAFLPSRKKN